ncbi:hypothetical protein Enr8_23130 [Blastopirellula retiformator]|uniref:Uncharacterized protein n=1 Tax=Blastopirellula retiformator TaxID=2527970 RepID=A0A5C5V8K7_9BACT|nr:hypothetical protein Enr8_23130 [Blastopirellula retiformator]
MIGCSISISGMVTTTRITTIVIETAIVRVTMIPHRLQRTNTTTMLFS